MDEVLKLDISSSHRFSDDEFFRLCQTNSKIRLERNKNGEILIMPPTGSETGRRNLKISVQVAIWSEKDGTGEVFDSSAGFSLPDGSVFSPDTAWINKSKWDALSQEQKEKFAPICPDFIIELKSKSDPITYLKEKMKSWIDNGVQLGWLINPEDKSATIYRANGTIERKEGLGQKLSGEDVLPGFELDLNRIW